MLLGLCVLVIFARGVKAQALDPKEFCAKPPAIYRGKHFEILVNQTVYDYDRGIEVTVRPKAGGKYSQISDMFLYVPGTTANPGQDGTHFVGKWTFTSGVTKEDCNIQIPGFVAGVKSDNPRWPKNKLTATWIAPMPEYYWNNYYRQFYSTPQGEKERQRPHIYFAVYVTPDAPVRIWAPGPYGKPQRRWYFAHSVKVENNEIKTERERRAAWAKYNRQMYDFFESMN